eukprot:7053398-Pyramimonas_sp.AAC.1
MIIPGVPVGLAIEPRLWASRPAIWQWDSNQDAANIQMWLTAIGTSGPLKIHAGRNYVQVAGKREAPSERYFGDATSPSAHFQDVLATMFNVAEG